MSANEISVTIGSISFNTSLGVGDFYLLRNTPELLSTLSTRRTETPRQGEHGVTDSLSFYDGRILTFEGELYASSQSARFTMQENLKKALGLSAAQSYSDDDGYVLVQITDEDGTAKQFYAKIIDPPHFSLMDEGMPECRRFEFVMFSDDPVIYSQSLTTDLGPESFNTTEFVLIDGGLPALKDGSLPALKDAIGSVMEVSNSGTMDTAPEIVISGPTTNPVVKNLTTGQEMDFNRDGGVALLSGETLTISVANRTAVKTDSGGSETNVISKLSLSHEWIYITTGTNRLTLFDDTTDDLSTQMTLNFREAWI